MNHDDTIIHRMFAVIDSREWERLRDYFHPDIVYERPGYDPLVGIDRVLRFYEHERIIAAGNHELERVLVSSSEAACTGRFIGTSRDGTPLDERYADFYTFEDGLIRTRRTYFYRPAV